MGQKGKSVLLRLVSEAGTGFFYTTRKNPVKTPHKLAFVKYDPVVRRRVLFGRGRLGHGSLGDFRLSSKRVNRGLLVNLG